MVAYPFMFSFEMLKRREQDVIVGLDLRNFTRKLEEGTTTSSKIFG